MNYPIIKFTKRRFRLFEAFLIFVTIISIGKLTAQEASFNPDNINWQYRDDTQLLANHLKESKGIPEALTIAIYHLESAHGTSDVALTHNNYFGIRQRHLNPDGSEYYTYRHFDSKVQCFIWWGGMIANRVYSECMDQEIRLMVACIAERYSEDYHWADKIMELIAQHKKVK